MKQNVLAVVFGAIGGFVGYLAVGWIESQGFYGMMLPGGLLGVAAGFAKSRSKSLAIFCGIAGTLLGFYTEWSYHYFLDDPSLQYFATHLGDLKPLTLLMIAVGGAVAFWIPYSYAGRTVR
jgi:hypothetical protein